MLTPKRDTDANALRRGRVSLAGADYFVTFNVDARRPVLIPEAADAILPAAQQLQAEEIWRLRCLIVMPDHVHLFFTLCRRLTLSQAIARLKHEVVPLVRSRGARWQTNFYDHRLRPDDSREAVIRYIWLNPYRSGLIRAGDPWPYFYCRAEDWAWFEGLTDKGLPFPEWLG